MSITSLFPNKALVDVLSVFLTRPEESFYQYSLVEWTGHKLIQVQRALKRIEAAGLITSSRKGRMVFYQAKASHPAFEGLRVAFLRTIALADLFKDSLLPIAQEIQFAFIFGSIAKGEDRPDSDIDLFIMSYLSLKKISGYLYPETSLGREINPVICSKEEFVEKLQKKSPFALELLNSPKIWLIGNQEVWEKSLLRLISLI